MNSQRRPIPLYPHPLLSRDLCQTQVEPAVESASDELSDFPPIRERKGTPSPPASVPNRSRPRHSPVLQKQSERRSSPSAEQGPPSQLRRRPPNSGLGNRNQLNTLEASIPVRRQMKKFPKSSLKSKRDADVFEVEDERPFKKKRLAFTNEDDINWLKQEIGGIKESVKEIAEHLRGNVEYRLEELRMDIRDLS